MISSREYYFRFLLCQIDPENWICNLSSFVLSAAPLYISSNHIWSSSNVSGDWTHKKITKKKVQRWYLSSSRSLFPKSHKRQSKISPNDLYTSVTWYRFLSGSLQAFLRDCNVILYCKKHKVEVPKVAEVSTRVLRRLDFSTHLFPPPPFLTRTASHHLHTGYQRKKSNLLLK
jgi:hypothetical protein